MVVKRVVLRVSSMVVVMAGNWAACSEQHLVVYLVAYWVEHSVTKLVGHLVAPKAAHWADSTEQKKVVR